MSSSRRSATSAFSSSFWPKKTSRLKAPSLAESVWNWPSTVCAKARIRAWPWSRANSTSQSLDHRHLTTCQPAPANSDSSSSTIRPLPRTGPSRRCRLQLMTKVQLSSFSRAASESAAIDSGSSISPSPKKPQTRRCCGPLARRQQAAVREVAHEARLVDRVDRADAHRAGRELPEVRHQLRMRIRGQAARAVRRRGQLLAVVGEVVGARAALRGRRGHRRPAPNAAGRRRGRRACPPGAVVAGAEEVVEADLEQVGRRGVAGDVAAELGRAAALGAVGAHHHRQRVPAHQRGEALLHRQVAGKGRLRFERDGVDVGRRPSTAASARRAAAHARAGRRTGSGRAPRRARRSARRAPRTTRRSRPGRGRRCRRRGRRRCGGRARGRSSTFEY